jgi:hypothetical protein
MKALEKCRNRFVQFGRPQGAERESARGNPRPYRDWAGWVFDSVGLAGI